VIVGMVGVSPCGAWVSAPDGSGAVQVNGCALTPVPPVGSGITLTLPWQVATVRCPGAARLTTTDLARWVVS
jgi:hypothetical protein